MRINCVNIPKNRQFINLLNKAFMVKSLKSLNIFAHVLTCTAPYNRTLPPLSGGFFFGSVSSHLVVVPQGGSSPQSPRPITQSPHPFNSVPKSLSVPMSSRSGPRAAGTDGGDFSHREIIKEQYYIR